MGSVSPFYHVKHSLDIQAPVDKVFPHWTSFLEFPLFLEGVESVRVVARSRYLFQIKGSKGRIVLWDALITRLVPNQYLEWGSDSQSPIQCSGRARFRERGNATRVDIEVEYGPATGWMAGEANRFMERLLPDYLAKDAHQIKDLIEAGSMGR